MRPEASQYISLDGAGPAVRAQQPHRMILRFTGYAASWFLLGAFLALQPLYTKNPQLRGGNTSTLVVAAICLGLALGLTALIRFTETTKEFRADYVYIPCLSSASLGLIITPFTLAISSRTEWNAAATVSVVVGAATTILYASLAMHAYYNLSFRKKFANSKTLPTMTLPALTPAWPEERSFLYPTDEYFPSKVKPGDGSNDELMAAQMRTLLLRSERPQSGNSSTYHIEMPPPPPMARNEYRNSIEMPKHVADYYAPEEDGQIEQALSPERDSGRLRAGSHADKSRSRSRSAASREERRMQIEAGT